MELDGSPVIDKGRDGFRATRHIMCAWGDYKEVISSIMGDFYTHGGAGFAKFPDIPLLRASNVHVEPVTDDQTVQNLTDIESDLAGYESYAQIDITYEMMPENDRPDVDIPEPEENTFVTYKMDFGCEFMQLTGRSLQWEGLPNVPVPRDALPTTRIPIIEHHLSWHRVTDPPWDTIAELVGGVNSTPFLRQGGDLGSIETMLFDGCHADHDFTDVELIDQVQVSWKLDYLFREKRIKAFNYDVAAEAVRTHAGWNHLWMDGGYQPDGTLLNAGWRRLETTNGDRMYPTHDLTNLFRFAANQ